MAQEFTIKSESIETKINQLLPTQGGYGAGVDFSASTMVVPIVDLTETAEGSLLRQDLQTAISLSSATAYNVSNTTTTLVNTPGYYRVFGTFDGFASGGAIRFGQFSLTDGISTKIIQKFNIPITASSAGTLINQYDFIVYLVAGVSLTAQTNVTQAILTGVTRQIADIDGNLVNP